MIVVLGDGEGEAEPFEAQLVLVAPLLPLFGQSSISSIGLLARKDNLTAQSSDGLPGLRCWWAVPDALS